MKSYRKELSFNVPSRRAFINITPQVDECLRESGIQEGLCLVNAMHITASVYINDAESGLIEDYDDWLARLAKLDEVIARMRSGPLAASGGSLINLASRRMANGESSMPSKPDDLSLILFRKPLSRPAGRSANDVAAD